MKKYYSGFEFKFYLAKQQWVVQNLFILLQLKLNADVTLWTE